MGSLEGAQAVLAGDQRIHVWSPASALYKDTFVQEWKVDHPNEPIVREEALALTPMVFVLWAERNEAFRAKLGPAAFDTVSRALAEKSGWAGIAGKPEWGLFKFGHTHPNESNSGLMTLVLMAYEFHKKSRGSRDEGRARPRLPDLDGRLRARGLRPQQLDGHDDARHGPAWARAPTTVSSSTRASSSTT